MFERSANIGDLLRKYSGQVPRYTSFPTVPDWDGNITQSEWLRSIEASCAEGEVSVYIHIPFCRKICSFCACNKVLLERGDSIDRYLGVLDREISYYVMELGVERLKVSQLHFGGGTPTVVSPEKFKDLMDMLGGHFEYADDCEKSVEAHPGVVNEGHIDVFARYGFSRVSFGVQDFDPKIQERINRVQSFEELCRITGYARKMGIPSINYDLIYGLPLQDLKCIKLMRKNVEILRPDRIAFYSYAHVPWKSTGQRVYSEAELPSAKEKLDLLLSGIGSFRGLGYELIGMDHFAKPGDELSSAVDSGGLWRNFMGYTTRKSSVLLGFGSSSISESENMYRQNYRGLEAWQDDCVGIFNGHRLSGAELVLKKRIFSIMTKMRCDISGMDLDRGKRSVLEGMVDDGLCCIEDEILQVTDFGRIFLRYIAHLFDETRRDFQGFSSGI